MQLANVLLFLFNQIYLSKVKCIKLKIITVADHWSAILLFFYQKV